MQDLVKNLSIFNSKKKIKLFFLPIFLFLSLLTLDRLCTNDFFRSYTENRVEYYLYQKKSLVEALSKTQKEKPNKQYLAFLGTSHMGEFSLKSFKNYSGKIIPYNFSAPLAPYSFHLYSLEKILENQNQLDYVILEIYPESAGEVGNQYALKYSYDFRFLWEHQNALNYQSWEIWIRSKVFHTSVFPFNLSEIYQKIKNPQKRLIYLTVRKKMETEITKFNGGIPNTFLVSSQNTDLDREAKKYAQTHYQYLKISESQIYFLEQIILTANKHHIKLIFWFPILYKNLYSKMTQSDFYPKWKKQIDLFIKKYRVSSLDMKDYETDLKCKKFIDIQHISGGCYPEITDILIQKTIQKKDSPE